MLDFSSISYPFMILCLQLPCLSKTNLVEIDEGSGTRTQSCVYLRWCFPHLYVHTTGIGCPDKVIYPLSWRTMMSLCLLLAGSSAFVTAKWTVIHHTIPIPSFHFLQILPFLHPSGIGSIFNILILSFVKSLQIHILPY